MFFKKWKLRVNKVIFKICDNFHEILEKLWIFLCFNTRVVWRYFILYYILLLLLSLFIYWLYYILFIYILCILNFYESFCNVYYIYCFYFYIFYYTVYTNVSIKVITRVITRVSYIYICVVNFFRIVLILNKMHFI